MSRETWNLIKHSKNFYVRNYRRLGSFLFLSACLNLALGTALYYAYFNQPARAFYATNGVTPPEKLTPMDLPNYTADALLASDPATSGYNDKVIPQ